MSSTSTAPTLLTPCMQPARKTLSAGIYHVLNSSGNLSGNWMASHVAASLALLVLVSLALMYNQRTNRSTTDRLRLHTGPVVFALNALTSLVWFPTVSLHRLWLQETVCSCIPIICIYLFKDNELPVDMVAQQPSQCLPYCERRHYEVHWESDGVIIQTPHVEKGNIQRTKWKSAVRETHLNM